MEAGSSLPIVPFSAFERALNHFHESGGAPSELHASVFPKDEFSGTAIALLVKAFKQLGLADDAGKSNAEALDPLINPDSRKASFITLLQRMYGTLIDLPLATASPNQFNKWFEEYSMNAEDTRKAKTFFLHAARANDIIVSKFILGKYKTRSRSTAPESPKPRDPAKNRHSKDRNRNKNRNKDAATGETRTVALRSGIGEVTVTVSVPVMALTKGDDRDFVLALIDVIDEYESE
ncbi:MAG TPA: hypothetical protein VFW34_07435 [Candidatus Rubrimentiphilum sp.]|nr:hypothetical protein [Candidatus Rubrimentiphilum sp.]